MRSCRGKELTNLLLGRLVLLVEDDLRSQNRRELLPKFVRRILLTSSVGQRFTFGDIVPQPRLFQDKELLLDLQGCLLLPCLSKRKPRLQGS